MIWKTSSSAAILSGLSVLMLAGCGSGEDSPSVNNAAVADEASEAVPSELSTEAANDAMTPDGSNSPASPEPETEEGAEAGGLAPAGSGLRFVGRWAAEQRLCESTAWRFTADSLRTPAGSVCTFTDVNAVPGGYDIEARCSAEAPEADDRLELRFAESARAMMFESQSIADAGLIYCGP